MMIATMKEIEPATMNSGFILTPWASSWKNLIRPALAAGIAAVLSLLLLLMLETLANLYAVLGKNLFI
jgi:hypothetical protein